MDLDLEAHEHMELDLDLDLEAHDHVVDEVQDGLRDVQRGADDVSGALLGGDRQVAVPVERRARAGGRGRVMRGRGAGKGGIAVVASEGIDRWGCMKVEVRPTGLSHPHRSLPPYQMNHS